MYLNSKCLNTVLSSLFPSSVKEMQRCPDIHILALLNSVCQFKPEGSVSPFVPWCQRNKKRKKRLSNAFSRCKTRVSESDVLLFKQQKHCPSGLMLSRVTTNPLGVHSSSSQMRGKLHQGQLLLYCADLLACHCSPPYFQKKHPHLERV